MRYVVMGVCAVGLLALVVGFAAPCAGVVMALADTRSVSTTEVKVPPSGALFLRSVGLSLVATFGAMLLGLAPAAVLSSACGRAKAILLGLVLTPLLMPPQVYAYSWRWVIAPNWLGASLGTSRGINDLALAAEAGLVCAGWLWPLVALVVAAGWRSTGRSVFSLALLDSSADAAFFRAAIPAMSPHLLAAASVVFGVTLLEYAIPHLMLVKVYATELQVLIDIAAPHGQVIRLALPVIGLVALLLSFNHRYVRRTAGWQDVEPDEVAGSARWRQSMAYGLSAVVWLGTVGLPVVFMLRALRISGQWLQGFVLFRNEWLVSSLVAVAAGVLGILIGLSTVAFSLLKRAGISSQRLNANSPSLKSTRRGGLGILLVLPLATMLIPPAALGIGFVKIFNHPAIASFYRQTPMVWTLALAARYAAIPVAVALLALGQRGIALADQARADGADRWDVLAYVVTPLLAPSLVAGGMMVVVLSLFEVVITQIVGPVAYPSIAMAILNQMHYGRDDVVITTSIIVMAAGVVVTQVMAWLLANRK